jgi:hypothetical protein
LLEAVLRRAEDCQPLGQIVEESQFVEQIGVLLSGRVLYRRRSSIRPSQ